MAGGELLAAGVELVDRLLAGFDRFREPDLVVLGEQRVLPDVGEVQPDEVFVVALDAIFGHRQLPQCGLTTEAVGGPDSDVMTLRTILRANLCR